MFEVTQLKVYNLFVTWVKFMSKYCRQTSIWPERDTGRHSRHLTLKQNYQPISDGSECPVKRLAAAAVQ